MMTTDQVISVDQAIANEVTDAKNKNTTKIHQVMLTVSVTTKMDYTTMIDVPIDTDKEQLQEIGAKLFEEVNQSQFVHDVDYWNKYDIQWSLQD